MLRYQIPQPLGWPVPTSWLPLFMNNLIHLPWSAIRRLSFIIYATVYRWYIDAQRSIHGPLPSSSSLSLVLFCISPFHTFQTSNPLTCEGQRNKQTRIREHRLFDERTQSSSFYCTSSPIQINFIYTLRKKMCFDKLTSFPLGFHLP